METEVALGLCFLEKRGLKEVHLYKELADPRSLKKKAKETKALKFTWRAATGALAEIKTEPTVAAAAIETLESGSAGCSSSGNETDAGLTEQRAETGAESGVARSFGLAARKPVKNTAAPVRSVQELLNSAEPDVAPPTAEGETAANAEAETPNPGAGHRRAKETQTVLVPHRKRQSNGEVLKPGQKRQRVTPPPISGMSGSSAASAVSSPAKPKPARVARKQPQKKKYQQIMQKVIKKLADLSTQGILQSIFTDVLCSKDCISIAQLLLTPSQFLLWERTWTAMLQNVLQQQGQVIAASLTRAVPSKWCRATGPRNEKAQSASAPAESDATTSTAGTLGPLSRGALGEAADVAE